ISTSVHLDLSLLFICVNTLSPIYSLFPYTTLFRSLQNAFIAFITLCIKLRIPLTIGLIIFAIPCHIGAVFSLIESQFLYTKIPRSEEHTSELQSRFDLVCRLLLEKKQK